MDMVDTEMDTADSEVYSARLSEERPRSTLKFRGPGDIMAGVDMVDVDMVDVDMADVDMVV